MNDTYDPVSETGEITFAGIGRLIKRSALRVVLYVLIGVLAASLIVLPVKMFVHTDPSVTARVEFVYSGIENGLDPFGTAFDKNQIKNNSVLTAAIAASGLESEIPVVADLREAIVITDVVSEEYQELKDLAASGNTEAQNQLLGYTYYPTWFDISVDYAALGLSRKETIGLLDNIIAAYRQYFTERYSNREAFTTQDFDLESDVEYVTYYIRYETYLLTINEYGRIADGHRLDVRGLQRQIAGRAQIDVYGAERGTQLVLPLYLKRRGRQGQDHGRCGDRGDRAAAERRKDGCR